MPRILLVEDHTLVRSGIRLLLERAPGLQIVGEAENGRQAVELCAALTPDLAIMDIAMPTLNGLEAARKIAAESPQTCILMLSMHSEVEYVRAALAAGARGYVLKNAASADLLSAIGAVLAGTIYVSAPLRTALRDARTSDTGTDSSAGLARLTAREREILHLIAQGNSGPEIARALAISERTVETHRQNVMAKLNIHSIAGLTRFALRHGVATLEE